MKQNANVVNFRQACISRSMGYNLPEASLELSDRVRHEIYLHLIEYGQTPESSIVVELMELIDLYADAISVESKRIGVRHRTITRE
jgi:hypothetical protein